MSKKEALLVYLDAMLGFRSAYGKFQKATGTLTDREIQMIQEATSSRTVAEQQKR